MILTLKTAPTMEPVSVATAKDHMRVTGNDEDGLIGAMITAARQWFEDMADRQFVTATRKLILDAFPLSIEMPRAPLASSPATTIEYVDVDGATQTAGSALYTVDTDSDPGRIYLAFGQSWPSIRAVEKAVTITYTCGYGDPSDVPDGIKQAILLLVAHWHNEREPFTPTGLKEVPLAIQSLMSQFKVQRA